jgi:pyruvate formate lyase activating enzyme
MRDGPGIRTTVFLQGCPLRCLWCHNPESWDPPPAGRLKSVAEVMEVVEKDRPFYKASGGGFTVSGGEPTYQFEFCHALLSEAKSRGIHTCLDTSGAFPVRRLPELLPVVDMWLLDFKATHPPCEWLGISDKPLTRVREELMSNGAKVRLRCPLLPGLNDTEEHLAEIARLSHHMVGVDLMPYHRLGAHKHNLSGGSYALEGQAEPTAAERQAWLDRLAALGAVRVGFG